VLLLIAMFHPWMTVHELAAARDLGLRIGTGGTVTVEKSLLRSRRSSVDPSPPFVNVPLTSEVYIHHSQFISDDVFNPLQGQIEFLLLDLLT
jgi:hypothetical protein